MIAFSNSPVSRLFVNLSQHLFTQLSLSNMCSILDFPFKELKAVDMTIILIVLVQNCLTVDQLIKNIFEIRE